MNQLLKYEFRQGQRQQMLAVTNIIKDKTQACRNIPDICRIHTCSR
jgi:hypothetical protein